MKREEGWGRKSRDSGGGSMTGHANIITFRSVMVELK